MISKENSPIISVVIPTYNRSKLLSYTLHSLTLQSLDKEMFEVIVSDDGSSDDTPDVVHSFSGLLDINYFYQDDHGYRVASARNLAIGHAKGTILVFVDSGIILSPTCLEEHLSAQSNHKNSAAVIGYVFGFDQENYGEQELGLLIDLKNPLATLEQLKAKRLFLDIREEFYEQCIDDLSKFPAPWVFFWTCNVSVSREMLNASGLFDENFNGNWGIEDLELGYRLHAHRFKFVLHRCAEAIHYPHRKDRSERLRQSHTNKLYFHNKHKTDATRLFLESDFRSVNEKLSMLQKV